MREEERVMKQIFHLQHHFFERVRQMMGQQDGIHPRQGPILGMLCEKEGMSQADIVRKMGVSAASVAVSIARLEKLGYVKRDRDPANQRANVVLLTQEGRDVAERTEALMNSASHEAMAGFSQEEKQTLEEYAKRMSDNLKQALMNGAKE